MSCFIQNRNHRPCKIPVKFQCCEKNSDAVFIVMKFLIKVEIAFIAEI